MFGIGDRQSHLIKTCAAITITSRDNLLGGDHRIKIFYKPLDRPKTTPSSSTKGEIVTKKIREIPSLFSRTVF
jgi:hypothetical protein